MSLRVVQWCTGIVGTSAVRAMLRHPGLEVVGCFAYSEEKRGVDVGTLCGLDPIGVEATDDVEALLALGPDCVLYNPLFPDVEEMVRILEAGINLVSTSYFITGRSRYFGSGSRSQTHCARSSRARPSRQSSTFSSSRAQRR